MSCGAPERELVTFWVAGSLSEDEAALAASHVEGCAPCRDAAASARALVDGLRDLHLSPDDVVAAAAHELDAPHLLVCSSCRDEVALLRTVGADLARLPAERPPARWRRAATLAAAAAVLVGVAVWTVPRRPAEDAAVLRGGPSTTVELLPPSAGGSGAPPLVWKPVAGAEGYRVSVFTADGRLVWTREIQAPPLRWPDDVPRAAGSYRWRVEALGPDSLVMARSPLAELEVRR